MTNPTSNFGWQMPTSTDLVTDLPADFEVFGQAVDTSLADLKGGTTGQVLKKNTNADMDFVWGADSAGMTNPMTTTGDTIYSSSGSTPARLGIGSTGTVLTVAGGVPTWAALPAAGGKTVIASGSLSGSVTSLTSIPGTYKDLELRILNYGAAAGGSNFWVRYNGDSTANRHSSNNAGATNTTDQRARPFDSTNSPILMSQNNGTFQGLGTVVFPNYANTTTWKIGFTYNVSNNATATLMNSQFYLTAYNQVGAITSLDLLCDGSTFTNGTYILYGVN